MTLIEELEAYADLLSTNSYDKAKRRAINKAIEIVKNHSDWIPVSQPPKEDGTYSVSFKVDGHEWVGADTYKNGEWFFNGWITAWKPLPEPYKGE